jgi:hypothetical protein
MSSTPYRQALQIALAVSLLLLGRAETGLANWVINTIDSGGSGDRGFYSSITIDTQGRPQVAYSGQMGQGIRYAVLNGGLWTIERVRKPLRLQRPASHIGLEQFCKTRTAEAHFSDASLVRGAREKQQNREKSNNNDVFRKPDRTLA